MEAPKDINIFKDFKVENITESGLKLFVIIFLTFVAVKMVNIMITRWKTFLDKRRRIDETNRIGDHERRVETLTNLVRKGIKILISIISFLMILKAIGIDIGPLLASAGILGLAIGFGAQNLVQDVISGFFILFEDQIRQGDVVKINGTAGLVEQINFRTVILRDLSGTVHVFRNGSITTTSNLTKGWSAAVLDIGVAYKEDIGQVMEIMKNVCEEMRQEEDFKELIIEEMEVFGLDSFGDSSLNIKARIKTIPLEQWGVAREYRKRLKEAFDKENIEIPFPHRSIYFGEVSKPFQFKSN